MTTAIIIDDHRLFAGGFSHVINSLEGIDAVECFENPKIAIEKDNPDNVGLIVSDLYIPGFEMLVWLRKFRIRFPNAALAVISSSISRQDRKESLEAGAHIYFEKHANPDLVIDGLQNLLAQTPVKDGFLKRTAKEAQEIGLTDKQIDILVHLARGMALKEIANRFDISPETVKSHLSRIYDLIGVSGRSAASEWARKHGLL